MGTWLYQANRIKGDKKRFGTDECDNVGAYVCKYMTKENEDERLKGRKTYLMSQNLTSHKKYMWNNEKDLLEQVYGFDSLFDCMLHKSNFTATYSNEYTGSVIYNQFNLKRLKIKRKKSW